MGQKKVLAMLIWGGGGGAEQGFWVVSTQVLEVIYIYIAMLNRVQKVYNLKGVTKGFAVSQGGRRGYKTCDFLSFFYPPPLPVINNQSLREIVKPPCTCFSPHPQAPAYSCPPLINANGPSHCLPSAHTFSYASSRPHLPPCMDRTFYQIPGAVDAEFQAT